MFWKKRAKSCTMKSTDLPTKSLKNVKKVLQYNVAKKKFKLTGDNKFLIKMRRMQAMLKNTVSPTEYKLCTEVIDNCKKNYGNIISEERWTYDELFYLHLYVLSRHTDTVEQAFLTE